MAALTAALYVPAASRAVQLSPDAVEYIDIARRLIGGEGFVLGVKAYHFGGTEILHDGLAERAPLYPLLVATLIASGTALTGVQVANALLAGASVALVSALGNVLFGRQNAILSGLLAMASPVVLLRMLPPMSEALAISLTLLALWLVVRFRKPPRAWAFLGAGVALGLGYLTRPPTLLLAAAVVAGVVAVARGRAIARPLTALAAGLLAFVVPISAFSLVTRGSLSYSGQSYLYSVFRDAEVLRHGYKTPLPTPAEFILTNPGYVVGAVLENAVSYAELLFLDPDWLLLLAPAWPLAVLALVLGRYPRAAWPVLLVASANFGTYALTWSNFQERYQLLTLLLLLPFAVDGLARLGLSRLTVPGLPRLDLLTIAVMVVGVVWLTTLARTYRGEFVYGGEPVRARTDRGVRWTGPPRWVRDGDLSRLLEWIDDRTDRRDGLAHAQPWPLTFFTGRPATLLPLRLDEERLRSFIVDYQVAYVLVDTRDRDRREYQRPLESLAAVGVRATAVGNYRVFDTRSLWRTPAARVSRPATSPVPDRLLVRPPIGYTPWHSPGAVGTAKTPSRSATAIADPISAPRGGAVRAQHTIRGEDDARRRATPTPQPLDQVGGQDLHPQGGARHRRDGRGRPGPRGPGPEVSGQGCRQRRSPPAQRRPPQSSSDEEAERCDRAGRRACARGQADAPRPGPRWSDIERTLLVHPLDVEPLGFDSVDVQPDQEERLSSPPSGRRGVGA